MSGIAVIQDVGLKKILSYVTNSLMRQFTFIVLCFCCLVHISNGAPLSIKSQTAIPWTSASKMNISSQQTSLQKNSDRVWLVTKLATLLGPTIAIHIYHLTYKLYEKHEPIISAGLNEMLSGMQTGWPLFPKLNHTDILKTTNGIAINSYVSRVAEEVIKHANGQLREQAIMSRMQMDDDQYEFRKGISSDEIREVTKYSLKQVLSQGAGKYLSSEDKRMVEILISQIVL